MQAQFTLESGEKMSLAGFYAVNRQRLKALPAEALHKLAASDGLELVYLHLQSMRNFTGLKDRLVGEAAAAPASAGQSAEVAEA
jgi:hypothetical protein